MATKNLSAQDAAPAGQTSEIPVSAYESIPMELCGTAITVDGGAVNALTEHQIKILVERGIDIELAVRMGWRRGRNGCIDIPYLRDGREVNCKTRSIEGDKRFYQVEGGEKCVYNVDTLKETSEHPLIITEGEMDCMIALQCGYWAVSVPDGAPAQEVGDRESVKYTYLEEIPKTIETIIIASDSDGPGTNLLHDIALRLGKHRCKWLKYPKGCKDLNDAFMRYGERGVKETIDRAQFVEIKGLHKLSELPPLPNFSPHDIGIANLYPHFRIRQGDLSVLTGIPSHGKTTFSNAVVFNMAKFHDWNICEASFEQTPQTEHKDALRTLYGAAPPDMQSPEQIAEADAWIDSRFCFITPPDEVNEEANMDWLIDRMAAAVTRFNVKMIVVDPWNEMDHSFDERAMSLTTYVGKAIKQFKKFAKKYMVHVMIIAHPAKMVRKKDGSYPIPSLYDISDSAHWYNKPDQGVIIHKGTDGKTLVRVAKSRYHKKLGKQGDVELKFDDYNYRFV